MTIDRWGSMTAPRPQVAPGTACSPCKAKGHHCDAYEIVGGHAVCLCCLDGVDCPRVVRGTVGGAARGPQVSAALTSDRQLEAECKDMRRHLKDISRTQFDGIARKAAAPAAVKPVPGAEPSSARRVFLCSRGCGKPTHRGQCRKDAPAPEPSPLCMRGCGGPRHPGYCKGASKKTEMWVKRVAESKVLAVKSEATLTKLAEVKDTAQVALSSKVAADGYCVLSLAEMPGRKYVGVYEEIVDEFMKLPKRSVLSKAFDNPEIAHTYMLAIVRIGRKRGLKMSQKRNGNTIYVWQV